MRSALCFAETPIEMDDEMMLFTFAVLIVANELLFGEGDEKYKRVHRYWVRPWIGRRDNTDTAFTLMQELQAVIRTFFIFFSMQKKMRPYLSAHMFKEMPCLCRVLEFAIVMFYSQQEVIMNT